MLALTLSATPRRLIAATSAMKPSASTRVRPSLTSTSAPCPRTTLAKAARFAANAREAVEAEVMPEHMTVKQTRKVTKWMPKALWAYSAAPAACGYLVTSSRYENAVIVATMKATRNGTQTAPPTSFATLPVTA